MPLVLVSNDRIIGGLSAVYAKKARALCKKFVKASCIIVDAGTAEMAKLTGKAFRDTSIAFANELSLLCKRLDKEAWELIELAKRNPRVNILQPGPSVSGHCNAVDPRFIVNLVPGLAKVVRTALEVNDGDPLIVIAEVGSKANIKKDLK